MEPEKFAPIVYQDYLLDNRSLVRVRCSVLIPGTVPSLDLRALAIKTIRWLELGRDRQRTVV